MTQQDFNYMVRWSSIWIIAALTGTVVGMVMSLAYIVFGAVIIYDRS